MTGFDFVAGIILLVSALIGFARGATREITTVVAFIAAVAGSIFGLRLTAPVAHHFIHTVWLANAAAALAGFIVIYVIVRLVGGRLTRGVHQTGLSSLDRALGLAVGLARGVVAVGVLVLLIEAVTPPERMPTWFTKARTYPMANAAGAALRVLAPKGVAIARRMGPEVENALAPSEVENAEGPVRAVPGRHGYSEAQRKALDDLVEKSR
ncbi:MAG TPA: CvpA family protein [Caulobacteraceae bacterium]|jgi:membrane protein required for colicin V production